MLSLEDFTAIHAVLGIIGIIMLIWFIRWLSDWRTSVRKRRAEEAEHERRRQARRQAEADALRRQPIRNFAEELDPGFTTRSVPMRPARQQLTPAPSRQDDGTTDTAVDIDVDDLVEGTITVGRAIGTVIASANANTSVNCPAPPNEEVGSDNEKRSDTGCTTTTSALEEVQVISPSPAPASSIDFGSSSDSSPSPSPSWY
jgi:hypothetical protein